MADNVIGCSCFFAFICFAIIVTIAADKKVTGLQQHDFDTEEEYDLHWAPRWKIIVRCFFTMILLLMIAFFMPTTKTLVTMYAVPRVVNNENMQKMPETMVNFVNAYIDKNKGE